MPSRSITTFDCDAKGCERQAMIEDSGPGLDLPPDWGTVRYGQGSTPPREHRSVVYCPAHWPVVRQVLIDGTVDG